MSSLGFIHDLRVADLPADVACQAQRCLLDLVGVAAAGRETELSRIVHDFAVRQMGASEGGSRLIFDGRRASAAGAAFAGASTIDSFDAHRLAAGPEGVAWPLRHSDQPRHLDDRRIGRGYDRDATRRGRRSRPDHRDPEPPTARLFQAPDRLGAAAQDRLARGGGRERASIALQPDAAAAAYTKRPMRSEADPQTM
ncbi:MmgE/PrpD family protein [Bosea vestrisii]|nr:MmgE/PrpD family protein [Bosea vestrisii]WID96643.1 MmgE/PrpD family protein [Bosea vestrisii]